VVIHFLLHSLSKLRRIGSLHGFVEIHGVRITVGLEGNNRMWVELARR
jgi:hypothetical protein